MIPFRSSFLALCLSACTAAAPIAAVAGQACSPDHPPITAITQMATNGGWALVKLNEVQLRHALAEYNDVDESRLNRKEVDGAIVATHDGVPTLRFLFFKGNCAVGQMLVVGPTVYARIMGHDA